MTTAILLTLITGSIAVSIVFWCVFLAMGFRWIRFSDYTRKRLVICALTVFVAGSTTNIAVRYLMSRSPKEPDPSEMYIEEAPAVLGENEYFVLGDFTISSLDSRYYELTYAVQGADIIGVVTHLYWPPSRWKRLR